MKKSFLLLLFCAFNTYLFAQINLPRPYKHKVYLLSYTPANLVSVAYSVARKLNINYNGPLFRVARTSDQVQMDIPLLNNEVDYQVLKTFIGSSTAKVVKLYDQSGNANDATVVDQLKGGTIATAGVLNLTTNTKRLTMTFGTVVNDSYYRLAVDVGNVDFSALYAGKANQPAATSVGVGGSGTYAIAPLYSKFSLDISTAGNTNKLGVTVYAVADYASSLITPTVLSSVIWTKANLSSTINIYLNSTQASINIDLGTRIFLLRQVLDNCIVGSQDFEEFVYYNAVLSTTQRTNILNNIKLFYVTP